MTGPAPIGAEVLGCGCRLEPIGAGLVEVRSCPAHLAGVGADGSSVPELDVLHGRVGLGPDWFRSDVRAGLAVPGPVVAG